MSLCSFIAMRLCIAIAMWLSLERAALAQAPSPADVAFEKGRQLAEANLHDRACAAFELSQRLDPQFGTQFNLAGCYAQTGKLATAWRIYRELSRSDTNAQRRLRAAELATEIQPRVATVRVRVSADQQSENLRVFIGATEVTSLLDVDIPFDTGRYEITASRTGYLPFRREINLGWRDAASVDVELDAEPAPVGQPAAPEQPESRIGEKIAFSAGVGVVAFGLFAGWRYYVNDHDELSPSSADRAAIWGSLSISSVVIGTATVALSGAKLFNSRGSHATHVVTAAGPGSASLFVSGAF